MDPVVIRGCAGSEGRVDPEIARYLESVRSLQQQYVDLLASAPNHVPREAPGLLAICAVLGRVSRSVFDAQRAFLEREVTVQAMLHACAQDDGVGDPVRVVGAEASVRQAIASLGREVVRTREDLDELAELLALAFEPDEPDTSELMNGIQSVLDTWWETRGRELAVVLADGRAKASLEQHLMRMAEQVPGPSTDSPVGSAPDGEVGFEVLLAELDAATAMARQERPVAALPASNHGPSVTVGFWLEADGGQPRPFDTDGPLPIDRAS